MRDPHVERLHFEIGSAPHVSYDRPEPLSFDNHLGRFECLDGHLVVAPEAHFADPDDARVEVEPFLRAWEMDSDLDGNIGAIRFEYVRADVVDRDPPPPGASVTIAAKAGALGISGAAAAGHITRRRYPQPPNGFRASPDVQHAYARWLAYRDGREPLQAMAYFVLTILEAGAGGRACAAHLLAVDPDVLDNVGRLSSTKGDSATARKATKAGAFQPLTPIETNWLEAAIRRLIRRLGEREAGAALEYIRMAELPRLA
jgi:hypothetical protein